MEPSHKPSISVVTPSDFVSFSFFSFASLLSAFWHDVITAAIPAIKISVINICLTLCHLSKIISQYYLRLQTENVSQNLLCIFHMHSHKITWIKRKENDDMQNKEQGFQEISHMPGKQNHGGHEIMDAHQAVGSLTGTLEQFLLYKEHI